MRNCFTMSSNEGEPSTAMPSSRLKGNSALRLRQLSKEILVRSATREGTQMEMPASENSGLSRRLLIVILLFTLVPLAANSAESPRPVSVKATCLGKISSGVLSSFREEIRASQKYKLVPNLSDNGRMDVVLTVDMNCTEGNDVAAVATVYGKAKCFSSTNCHLTIDSSSIRSDLCDSKAAAECGRTLFKAFDNYMGNPLGPRLKLQ